jgi:hypothetical protein
MLRTELRAHGRKPGALRFARLQVLLIHSLNLLPGHVRFMGPKTASECMGDVHQLMDENPGLVLPAELIESLGDNLNDIVRPLIQGELHDLGKTVAPGNSPPTAGTFAPQADHSRGVDVGHLYSPEDVHYSFTKIMGQFIPNHKGT